MRCGTEQTGDMSMVKVGDRVRCLAGRSLGGNHGAGFVGVIHSIEGGIYHFTNGDSGYAYQYELVSDGPVRTVTRRIVPGVYGRLWVAGVKDGEVAVAITSPFPTDTLNAWGLTAPELDDLAMVASQLAEALRDLD